MKKVATMKKKTTKKRAKRRRLYDPDYPTMGGYRRKKARKKA